MIVRSCGRFLVQLASLCATLQQHVVNGHCNDGGNIGNAFEDLLLDGGVLQHLSERLGEAE